MSSNVMYNLSNDKNFTKPTVNSEEVMSAVNHTLTKYYYEAYYAYYASYYNLHKNLFKTENSAVMLSEKLILCDMNACLWDKAFISAIGNITCQTYPHYIIVQKVINYLLNTISDENFGRVEEFFCKLLITHPPKTEMFDYYWQIMSAHFLTLTDEKTEEETLIFCLIEAITSCLRIEMKSEENNDCQDTHTAETDIPGSVNFVGSELRNLEVLNSFNKSSKTNVNEKPVYFSDLSSSEKLKRCLLAFNFVCDVLETDFMFWLQSKKLNSSCSENRPLISSLIWPNVRDCGLINKKVYKILDLYEVVQLSNSSFLIKCTIEKFVTLLGEVIRCSSEIDEIKYPFIGTKSDNFFRELSFILYQCIKERKRDLTEKALIINFKPPWMRLFLCSRLLSLLTGYQCPPELTGVYDILEHIAHTENRNCSISPVLEKPKRSINSRMLAKLKKYKSINAKLRNGKTLLHKACEENEVEKIRALLTFPELDVNAIDIRGWTALHVAAQKGNTNSVQELLSFCPGYGSTQKLVNSRAQGPQSITPLMCAVKEGHAKVCQLLLEHSGSVLLEDVNDLNQTPLELSSTSEVSEILQHFKKNNVWTLHSHKDINLNPDFQEIIMKLCVEMIQAYFCTYRTWDVYKALKHSKKHSAKEAKVNFRWDYLRYNRDIKRNIYKLRRLIPKLEPIKEFKGMIEIYERILSFNRIC